MLGAPAGASTPFGKSGVETLTVRPILPRNGGSGLGEDLLCLLRLGRWYRCRDAPHRDERGCAEQERAPLDLDGLGLFAEFSLFIVFLSGEPCNWIQIVDRNAGRRRAAEISGR